MMLTELAGKASSVKFQLPVGSINTCRTEVSFSAARSSGTVDTSTCKQAAMR